MGARGRYVIPFDMVGTWWDTPSLFGCGDIECPFTPVSAVVFIGEDCNNNNNLDELDISQGSSQDLDGNHVPDECDPDCQGNGVIDGLDILNGTSKDCNANSVPDECEIANGSATDCNANGVLDGCEAATCVEPGCRDCNGNGVLDECDIANGFEHDSNYNGVPDICEGLVPTVSMWGLVVLTLLLLAGAKVASLRTRLAH